MPHGDRDVAVRKAPRRGPPRWSEDGEQGRENARRAKVLEAELMMEMAAEPDRGQHTVREIVEGFIGSVRLRGSAASADYYEQAMRLAPDWFLDRDVSTVDVYVVDVLYKRLIGDGMTASNVVKLNRLLSAAFSARSSTPGSRATRARVPRSRAPRRLRSRRPRSSKCKP
jgi:hypothetical protein